MTRVIQLVILLTLLLCLTGGCEARWVQRFDDSYWELFEDPGTIGSWDDANQEWDSEVWFGAQTGIFLRDIGTWAEGFRPTKIRVTFTGAADINVGLADTELNTICPNDNITSGGEVDITFVGYDIDLLIFNDTDADTFSITNIEFLRGSSKLLWIWLRFFNN